MNIFIAGPRTISKLDDLVIQKIAKLIEDNYNILVGDANGVDKSVQNYCNEQKYRNVKVYATKGNARNNIGKWEVHNVDVPKSLKGFDFYAAKDYEMAKDANYGFMIWNGISKGTLNNIVNLLVMGKETILYYSPEGQLYVIKSLDGMKDFISRCEKRTQELFSELLYKGSQLQLNVY